MKKKKITSLDWAEKSRARAIWIIWANGEKATNNTYLYMVKTKTAATLIQKKNALP